MHQKVYHSAPGRARAQPGSCAAPLRIFYCRFAKSWRQGAAVPPYHKSRKKWHRAARGEPARRPQEACDMKHEKKQAPRFAKWLAKAAAAYLFFFLTGLLMGLVPAGSLGLSGPAFFSLRMCWMLLGPVYVTLVARLILAFLPAARKPGPGAAEKGTRLMLAVAALLLLADLSGADTLPDLAGNSVQARGLHNLAQSSRRHPQKGGRFLAVFLTAGLCLLGLELLTLLVCIIVFAPLGQTASRAFLLCIALTALALVLTALAAAFLSGFQGDRAAHARQLAQRKQAAAAGGALVLESDPALRKRFLRFPKALCLVGCPALVLAGFAVLYVTKGQQGLAVHLLRQGAQALSAAGFLGFFAAGLYWANCSGTSLVQRIYLSDGALRYTGYSGSMEERVEFSYLLLQLERVRVGRRALHIRGRF